jgi:hypothetical protein
MLPPSIENIVHFSILVLDSKLRDKRQKYVVNKDCVITIT